MERKPKESNVAAGGSQPQQSPMVQWEPTPPAVPAVAPSLRHPVDRPGGPTQKQSAPVLAVASTSATTSSPKRRFRFGQSTPVVSYRVRAPSRAF